MPAGICSCRGGEGIAPPLERPASVLGDQRDQAALGPLGRLLTTESNECPYIQQSLPAGSPKGIMPMCAAVQSTGAPFRIPHQHITTAFRTTELLPREPRDSALSLTRPGLPEA